MRKATPKKQSIKPDIIYNSNLVATLINTVMKNGKKTVAQKIVYSAFEILLEKTKKSDPLEIYYKALENVKPQVKVKSRRVGGSTYQVPDEVPAEKQVSLALRWIVQFSRAKKGKPMAECLANEIFDAYNETGSSFKKKEDTHKMASANKAFAHFRW